MESNDSFDFNKLFDNQPVYPHQEAFRTAILTLREHLKRGKEFFDDPETICSALCDTAYALCATFPEYMEWAMRIEARILRLCDKSQLFKQHAEVGNPC